MENGPSQLLGLVTRTCLLLYDWKATNLTRKAHFSLPNQRGIQCLDKIAHEEGFRGARHSFIIGTSFSSAHGVDQYKCTIKKITARVFIANTQNPKGVLNTIVSEKTSFFNFSVTGWNPLCPAQIIMKAGEHFESNRLDELWSAWIVERPEKHFTSHTTIHLIFRKKCTFEGFPFGIRNRLSSQREVHLSLRTKPNTVWSMNILVYVNISYFCQRR